MSLLGGRGGRSDDWSSPHLRARARASERLDGPLDQAEATWLDEHLAGCPACAAAAADYASQKLELQALRGREPVPPRDLWARTAAAIERESRPGVHRRRRSPQSLLAPYALLAGALIVAVAVGTLSVSQLNNQSATPSIAASVSTAAGLPSNAVATPIAVGPGSVAYLTSQNGLLSINHLDFNHVCGPTTTCATSGPADTQAITPVSSPDAVFGAADGDKPLVVVTKGNGSGGQVFAVAVPDREPEVTPTPTISTATTASPSETASTTAVASESASPALSPDASATPHATPSEPASSPPSSEPPASTSVPAGAVEIARNLKVLDTTAAYAPDGSAFAFTARPIDGSHGPDIYLWNVGDAQAKPITTDHRSVFGSWADRSIVGSTVTASPDGSMDRPQAFVIREASGEPTALPQVGLAWRPVVDPTGRTAVYWSGRLAPTADGLGWTTRTGKLVVGRWDDVTTAESKTTSTGASSAADASQRSLAKATAPADAAQEGIRSETTIANGPLAEWDARWDETGTRLAIWIANESNPAVGRLSLYVVDPFDGRIDLSKPPLEDEPAMAGFAIADGHLAWAVPPKTGSTDSSVRVLAWHGDAFGKVESAPGDVILVR
jgi:predicted anti-sigma-YlaC factor YlaD